MTYLLFKNNSFYQIRTIKLYLNGLMPKIDINKQKNK